MSYKRFSMITDTETPHAETPWVYLCDTESDVTSDLPTECQMAIVLVPTGGHSQVRVRNTDGEWKELG